jgi:RNA polymerase sigma factor (sigma-70 family)
MQRSGDDLSDAGEGQFFAPTQWNLVLLAGQLDSPEAEAALSRLCQTYWRPLYIYIRRLGRSPEDAQDLTQAFFEQALKKNYFSAADREKGKFRSFLLLALKGFMANEWDKAHRIKRGGGQEIFSLDERDAEDRLMVEPATDETPEMAFDRRWARALLERVLDRLGKEYAAAGKQSLFDGLKQFLLGEKSHSAYAELASGFGSSEGAIRVSVHRLRQRYRDLLQEEIACTVSSPGDVDEELQHLFAALRG